MSVRSVGVLIGSILVSLAILVGGGCAPEAASDPCAKWLEPLKLRGKPVLEHTMSEITMHYDNMFQMDPARANAALDYFSRIGATKLLCLALEHPAPEVQIHAVSCLASSNDKKALPALLAMFTDNYGTAFGGSAIQTRRRQLAGKALVAMGQIMGVDFAGIDLDDFDRVSNAARTVQREIARQNAVSSSVASPPTVPDSETPKKSANDPAGGPKPGG
jgi:hypothetical protein